MLLTVFQHDLLYTIGRDFKNFFMQTAGCLEVFCKKRYSYKFHKIHRKTPVLESLFNKVAGLASNFIKEETLSKNTFFTEHLWATAFMAGLSSFVSINVFVTDLTPNDFPGSSRIL